MSTPESRRRWINLGAFQFQPSEFAKLLLIVGLASVLAARRGVTGPARLTLLDETEDRLYARAFRDQLERVEATPRVPEWERIANEIRLVAERVVDGELTVPAAQRELDARADRILEKRRSLLAQESGN